MTGTQLSFDVGPTSPPAPRIVYAFDPAQVTNAQRIVDIAALGYLPSPVLDCTSGLGMFWERWRPEILVATDLDPAKARDAVADFHALPFRDRAFPSVVFDPPYKAQHGNLTQGGRDLSDRYGFQGALAEIGAPWLTALPECLRVADRFCIVKCQDSTASWQSYDIATLAASLRWRMKDILLLGNTIPNPKTQRHARRNYSVFMVLQRVPSRTR